MKKVGWAKGNHSVGYRAAAPREVKMAILKNFSRPRSIWVESGTYRGETARYLARIGKKVHTIEPSPELFAQAKLADLGSNVVLHQGLSEDVMPSVVEGLSGHVAFWLDGHFSAGETWQGPVDTPILVELSAIASNLHRFRSATIFVDDFRCFANWGGKEGIR